MEQPKFLTLEEARAQEEYYQKLEHTPVKGGLLQLLKESVAEPIVVPTLLTKEDFIEICRTWAESRTKREIWYFPISHEMDRLMTNMIDDLPNGGYRIKTTRDDLDNSKS